MKLLLSKKNPFFKYNTILLSALFLLLLWQLSAAVLDNDILIPYPRAVFEVMLQHVSTPIFYTVIAHTLLRALSGLLIAFTAALLCSFISYFSPLFKDLLSPLILLAKSVPNISFIIIVLVWFGSEQSAMIIVFLILFPSIYSSLYAGLQAIPQDLKNVLKIYPETNFLCIKRVYLPELVPYLHASISSGLSLAFKVGVMSEIIGQVQTGIGRQLNICRLNLDMAGIFAWTGWIILLLVAMDFLHAYIRSRIGHSM